MKESSIAGKNIPNTTVDASGRCNCEWYDWSSFLGEYFRTIPNITKYHHFSVSQENPSEIVSKIFAESPEEHHTMFKRGVTASSITDALPKVVKPKGLDAQRQWYLYEQVRPFCHSNLAKDLTCPKPTVPKPGEASAPSCSQSLSTSVTQPTPTRKRKAVNTSSQSKSAPQRKRQKKTASQDKTS